MAKLLKLRRGTTSEHSSFTGAEGEVTIDTTKDTAVVHDGSTAGGHPLVKENAEVTSTGIASNVVDEDNLKVSNTPTNGQYLQAQSGASGGLTWSTVSQTPEGTAVLSTGESGGTKFLREDGDNSCSWQPIPVPTSITVADESTDTSCNVLFTTAATGNLAPKTGTNLTFNSNTGELTASGFIGNLAGNASSASTGTTVTVTANESSDELLYLAMVDGTSGSQAIEADSSLQYNPSTGVITTTGFSGALTGNATTATTATKATNVTVADESSDTTCFPTFVTAATGDLPPKTGSNLTFNSSTGALVATIVEDSKGDVRSIPQNTQANAYTLASSDNGKHILLGNTIYINNGALPVGGAVTIVNNTSGNLAITKQVNTMYWTADGTNASRTLATRGICTILYTGSTECYISGSGLS